MFAVIIGCSEIGYHLAKSLVATGHEVVVVEKDRERCQLLIDEVGSISLQGDGTDEAILKQAGLARADVLIAVAGRDDTNLVICQMSKHIVSVPRTMAVIRDPKNEALFHVLGIDVVVNSIHLVLASLEEGIPGRPLVHLSSLRSPGTELISVSIPSDAGVVGMRLDDVELPPHSFISLVIKNSGATLPTDGLVLEAEDELVAVTMTGDEQTLYDILTGV
ncbi:MAG: TrkA family potassium uptake protein [Dehalococcoidia bacterium]|nr:TrkA family potassium uptake protein [Dehalococcoidia bacterium]